MKKFNFCAKLFLITIVVFECPVVEMSLKTAHKYSTFQPLWTLSCKGRYIVTGGLNGLVQLWSQEEPWEEIAKLSASSFSVASVISLNKTIVSLSMDGHLKVWDVDSKTCINDIPCSPTDGFAISVNPKDHNIAAKSGPNGAINILNLNTGSIIQKIERNGKFITSLSWSPDGSYIAAGTVSGEISLYSVVKEPAEVVHLTTIMRHRGVVRSLCFSPDCKYLVSGSDDGNMNVLVVDGKNLILFKTIFAHSSWVTSIDIHEKLIASSSYDNQVKIWDMSTGELLETLKEHMGPVWQTVWNTTGKKLITVSDDGDLLINNYKDK